MVIGYGLWYCMVLSDSRVGRARSPMTRVTTATAHELLDSYAPHWQMNIA